MKMFTITNSIQTKNHIISTNLTKNKPCPQELKMHFQSFRVAITILFFNMYRRVRKGGPSPGGRRGLRLRLRRGRACQRRQRHVLQRRATDFRAGDELVLQTVQRRWPAVTKRLSQFI